MDKDIAISVKNVSKTFRIPHEKVTSLRGAAVSAFKKKSYEEFKVYPVADAIGALDDVSFEACPKRCAYRCGRVKKGEFFACLGGRQGIIRRNGSGKAGKENIVLGVVNSVAKVFYEPLTDFRRFATLNLLKPPVLTLWAWRGFIYSNQ